MQLLALTAHLLGLHLAPTFHGVPAPKSEIAIQEHVQGQVACDPSRLNALSGSHCLASEDHASEDSTSEEAQCLAFHVDDLESSVQP